MDKPTWNLYSFLPMQKASPLGLKKSFGFGDRLGSATPGHLAASKKYDFAPIFAQQSIREMSRTRRTPSQVMDAAVKSLEAAGYEGAWGADADHLKNADDAKATADAGFCFFTIDPSDHVNNGADTMNTSNLEAENERLVADGIFESADWMADYLDKPFEVSETLSLAFGKEHLLRAAVKYGRAIAHSAQMSQDIDRIHGGRPYEIEISVDETDTPTTPLEHLFFGLELKKRGVRAISLAPRFVGDFEKGIDYKGDLQEFERQLVQHVAIAKYCGPYKISVHSGSDKFSIYPIAGRVCGDLIHVKTAGTSYLEALRVVVRTNLDLFKEIVAYSVGRFEEDKKTYHISTSMNDITAIHAANATEFEQAYLNENVGRQLLHVTFGSVLTVGKSPDGKEFGPAIRAILEDRPDLHEEVLEKHFTKHLSALTAG